MVAAHNVYAAAKEAVAKAKQQAEALKTAGQDGAADAAAVPGTKAAADIHYRDWPNYTAAASHADALKQQLRSMRKQGNPAKTLARSTTVLLMALQEGSTQPTPVAVAKPCFPVVSIHVLSGESTA